MQESILSPVLSKHGAQSKKFCQDKTFYYLKKAGQTFVVVYPFLKNLGIFVIFSKEIRV